MPSPARWASPGWPPRCCPGDKADEVARLQAEGRTVAFVGDGINDAPALIRADLGMAVGTGTDVAIEAGDVVLMSGDPALARTALGLAAATFRTIRQNLFWAFAYNTAAIPLAAAGLARPHDRRGGNGAVERLGGHQLAAPAALRAGAADRGRQGKAGVPSRGREGIEGRAGVASPCALRRVSPAGARRDPSAAPASSWLP